MRGPNAKPGAGLSALPTGADALADSRTVPAARFGGRRLGGRSPRARYEVPMPMTAMLAPALILTFGVGLLGFGLLLSRARTNAARKAADEARAGRPRPPG